MMNKTDRIFVAGHKGMVGSAIVRILEKRGFRNLLTAERKDLDLQNKEDVTAFFKKNTPDYVFLAAARVGGIKANKSFPADFLLENLNVQNNVIMECVRTKVKKLIFLGSSCIYPRECPQPMKEEYLLTGPLEPTNEGYALAKIAGIKLAQYCHSQYGLSCINLMPCNLYGTNDCFDLNKSHVLSALVRKFVDAKDAGKSDVEVWGTGSARREFMHVNDMAEATVFLAENYHSPDLINVGTGNEVSIKDLAEKVGLHSGFTGKIVWNTEMPDGMPLKCLDIAKLLNLGYTPHISLDEGIKQTIREYQDLKKAGKIS